MRDSEFPSLSLSSTAVHYTSSNRDHRAFPDGDVDTPAKKRFGSNLNRLTQPPPSNASAGNNKAVAQSLNGLMTLSNKRQPSAASAPSSSGILSSRMSTTSTVASSMSNSGSTVASETNEHNRGIAGSLKTEMKPHFDAWGRSVNQPEVAFQRCEPAVSTGVDLSRNNAATPAWIGASTGVSGSQNVDNESSLAGDKPSAVKIPVKVSEENHVPAHTPKHAATAASKPALFDPATGRLKEVKAAESKPPKKAVVAKSPPAVSVPVPKRNVAKKDNKVSASSGASIIKPDNNAAPATAGEKVIQLASYEDRNRGSRVPGAQRMLYDPKSGSLVAVKPKEEASSTKVRKDRKKTRQNKETKQDVSAITNNEKRSKFRKDDNDVSGGHSNKFSKKSRPINKQRKFPRTCGVLFTRDKKGIFYCVDGCDGDLGYGSHSVPGGRINNTEAYFELAQLGEMQNDHSNMATAHQDSMNMFSENANSHGNVNDFRNFESLDVSNAVIDNSSDDAKQLAWVKAEDKIELVTGMEESPMLQATAKEWAPSVAALAAAAAVVKEPEVETATEPEPEIKSEPKLEAEKDVVLATLDQVIGVGPDGTSGEENHIDSDDDGPFGLGFDPTFDMDSMIRSPGNDPMHSLDDVNLSSLSLQPALQPSSATATGTSHIFAFESGATWGTGDSAKHADWGVPNSTPEKAATAASFLGFSGSPWGASTVPGFANTSLDGGDSRPDVD